MRLTLYLVKELLPDEITNATAINLNDANLNYANIRKYSSLHRALREYKLLKLT